MIIDRYGFCKPVSERPDNVKNGIRLTNGSGFEVDIEVQRKFKYLESYRWSIRKINNTYVSNGYILVYNLGIKEVYWSVSNATSGSISSRPIRGQ